MEATDVQDALNNLALAIKKDVQEYLDATGHTNRPQISMEFLDCSTIGNTQYECSVTVEGSLVSAPN